MKLIILDRDGVINLDSDAYIKSPEEWLPIEGSAEAIAKLNQAGFTVAVATNQSGIGRGYYTRTTLDAIHQKMHAHIQSAGGSIDHIVFCPHTPDDHCDCRKPASGLFKKIASHYQCGLDGVPIVGDSWRDLEAGMSEGCSPILVKTGNGLNTLKKAKEFSNVRVFDNLLSATKQLIFEDRS